MYGLIVENVVSYINKTYGSKVWQEVKFISGIEEDHYAIGDQFSEGLFHRIVWAMQDVTNERLDGLMEAIGSSFYEFTSHYEYNKMYGLILENITTFLKQKFGEKTWREVVYVAGLDQDTFEIYKCYSEGLVHRIVWAAQDVTGMKLNDLMEEIGATFYSFTARYEYNKILRILGRSFPQFLNGLDNLHEYLRFTFPKLKPPSFYCEHESRTGLTLHYRSKRRGFLHYVKGQIKSIAMVLYQTEVKVELLDHETEENMEHVIMRLHFNNMDFRKGKDQDAQQDEIIRSSLKITSDIFFKTFPFIIVFNRGMRIRNIGLGLLRLMPRIIGKKINQEFVLVRPLIKFRWEEIMLYSNNIFEIMSMEPMYDDGTIYVTKSGDAREMQEERRRMSEDEKIRFLSLKGQMMYMEEWESICFLGIPVMEDLRQMYSIGLYINDFALHDSSRDLVLTTTQQSAELKLLMDQESKKREKMNENMEKLKAERERTDQLLYQLLPKTVADQLRSGDSAVNTCEEFDSVTVLFTDVVGFTNLCSGIEAMDVVNFLNDMYSAFDAITEKHGAYKVETIGDAYMIVSGAPQRTEYHAEYIADCTIAIIEAVGLIRERSTRKKVQIRAGIHTGPVVAGVVGVKMPRYCLFGDNVTIAHKMESSGQPMKIQVSDPTRKALNAIDPKLFKFSPYTTFELKAGIKFKTYFLDGKNGPARVPTSHAQDRNASRIGSVDAVYTPVDEEEIVRAESRMSRVQSSIGSAITPVTQCSETSPNH